MNNSNKIIDLHKIVCQGSRHETSPHKGLVFQKMQVFNYRYFSLDKTMFFTPHIDIYYSIKRCFLLHMSVSEHGELVHRILLQVVKNLSSVSLLEQRIAGSYDICLRLQF